MSAISGDLIRVVDRQETDLLDRTDLGDRDYRPVIRALFGILQREKSAYLRAERPTVRTTIATRLTNIALTLRTLVEAVLHTFSPKTIRFVLSGIKDVLQLDEGWLLDAVAPDLTRILASITGYPSHVEHLPHDEWIDLISFTAELLSEAVLYESEGQLVHNNGGQLDSHSSVNGLISEPGLSHVSSSRQTKLSTLDRASTEEVITALEQLTAFARSPGLNLSKHIANVVVAFLRSSHVPGRSHPVAFRICRNLVSQHGLDSTQWTQQLLRDVIPLMIRFWGTRSESTSLREGILLLLLEGWNFLQEVYSSPRSKGDRTSIDTLIDVLSNDYSRRSDKEQLTVDDLLFACPGLSPPLTGVPLQKRLFSLRRLRLRTEVEQAWTILQFCASFAGDTKHRPSNQEPLNNEENDDGPRATKRIKTSHMSIKPLGRVKNQSSGEALLVLQVLLFRLEEQHLSLEELSATLDSLKLSMSGDDNLIGAWAFIAVSR